MLLKFIISNKKLLRYIAVSYLDKGIIFLVPLFVLNLFLNKDEYVIVEYIYSYSIIIIPFLDLGINGYIFYGHRDKGHSKRFLINTVKVFENLYLTLFLLGIAAILVNRTVYVFEEYLEFIIIRSLYVMAFGFLTSLYRILNKPEKALYISLIFNSVSLIVLVLFYLLGYQFRIELVFAGQSLFIALFFLRSLLRKVKDRAKAGFAKTVHYIKMSLVYAWPSILQVFILMYISNYGKLNVIDKLSLEEGAILSITQRYSFLVQIMHTAILAFIIKGLYEEEKHVINKKALTIYWGLITLTSIVVFFLINFNFIFSFPELSFMNYIKIILLINLYTFMWCFYSYLEVYFGRENRNIYKLFLALLSLLIFIYFINILQVGFLEKLSISMVLSILIPLTMSILILRKKGYKLQ